MSDFYCDNVFSGKTPVKKVEETDSILAFYHTNPSWTIHIVIVPKEHIVTLTDADETILTEILEVTKKIIEELKLNDTNFKLITNGGSFQDSKHLHFHLVSGKKI